MGMRVRAGIVLLLVFAIPACSGLKRRSASEQPVTTVSVGQRLVIAEQADPSPERSVLEEGGGRLALRITDDNDLHPAGIPVKISGPKDGTVVSDADGNVVFSGPPGFYEAKIPTGCHDDVLVHDGGSGKIGLVEGTTVKGTLLVIWQHRYGPSGPAFTDVTGDWKVGKTVKMTYDVRDHCSDDRAPSASFPTYAFDTSRNLKLVGTPVLRADREGRATVSVSCTSAGAIGLVARDRTNPSEQLDLLQLAVQYSGVPKCVG